MLYVFGDYTLDTERYELHRTGVRLRIEPRVFDLLTYLVQHPGHTVQKDELCSQLWPDQPFISDDRLINCVAQVRKALGDTGQAQQFIQTIHSRGYRFIVPVNVRPHGEADRPAPAGPPSPRPTAAHDPAPTEVELTPRVLPPGLSALSTHTEKTESTLAAAGPGILTAERRQLTVVVCHVPGFAELAASRDPEALLEVTRDYHAMCAEVVRRFAGHIVQTQGDVLVVYFGSPQTHEDDARRAVQTGLGLVDGLKRLKQRHTQDWGVQLATQVGIHTGLVVMSSLGPGDPREPLALGTTPTIAAQVQGLAAPDTVVISATTLRLVEGYFVCQPVVTHGFDLLSPPLTVYQVLQASPAQSRFEVTVTQGLTPLVGRDHEVGLLRERWAQAKDGQGQVVVLSGEAGIGKSRLAQVLKEHLAVEVHTRIEFHCSPYYQQSALYPIVEHLRWLLRLRGGEIPEAQLHTLEAALAPVDLPLEEVVPLLASLLSLPLSARYAPRPLTPVQQKQQTFAALLAWLLQEAEQQPVCCIMEDLHWADPSTLEWLRLLIDQIPTARVFLLLLFRPDFHLPWAVPSPLTHLALSRLSPQQTAGMIAQVVGGKPLPAEVVQQVVATTDGVPLFVEELTKMVLESGLVTEQAGHYELLGPLPPLAIPATLHDSLMARLDRLGPAKQVAHLGAVVGREFAYEVLQAVAPMEEATLQQGLAQLVDAELLYQRGLPPQARYRFKHALIQEAAYQTLLRSTRRQYHQQIAQVLEDRFPDTCQRHPELVAHHYTEAGCGAQALPYWQQAGQHAIERSANLEAIGHLTKGLEVLQTLPETPERAQHELTLRLALGAALMMTKGYAAPEVEQTYARARDLCQQLGQSAQLFPVLHGLWRLSVNRAELHTARALGEQLVMLAQNSQDPALLLQAYRALGPTVMYGGELALARAHLEQGIALYDRQQHRFHTLLYGQDPGVVCHIYAALALWLLGYPEQAQQRVDEVLSLAQELEHPFSLAYVLSHTALIHQLRREVPATHMRTEAIIALSREKGFSFWLTWGTMLRGWAVAQLGQREEGTAAISEGLAAYQATGAGLLRPMFLGLLADAYGLGGEATAGLRVLADASAVMDTTGERWWEPELHRLRGELLLGSAGENQVAAEACFHQALQVAHRQQAKALELRTATSLSRLWQRQDKRAEARQLLAETYCWFTEGFDTPDLQEAKALLEAWS